MLKVKHYIKVSIFHQKTHNTTLREHLRPMWGVNREAEPGRGAGGTGTYPFVEACNPRVVLGHWFASAIVLTWDGQKAASDAVGTAHALHTPLHPPPPV